MRTFSATCSAFVSCLRKLRVVTPAAALAALSFGSIGSIGATAGCGSSDDNAGATDGGVDGTGGNPDGAAAFDARLPDGALNPDAPIQANDSGTPANPSDVLEYHKHASRDGVYLDAKMTKAAAATLHRDTSFSGKVDGWIYAQPLYVAEGPSGKPAFYVATETNNVYALDAVTGSVIWQKTFPKPSPQSAFQGCGNIDPLGITGTPIIDLASRTIFFNAMTEGPKHLLYALSIDDGSTRTGWPLDTTMIPATTESGSTKLDAVVQNERGALAVFNGSVYVPYGGHIGDCGDYHGWVIGVPIGDPASAVSWATDSLKSGIWAAGGIASDGTSLLVTTGNGESTGGVWKGSEGVIRLQPGPTFSKATADYFVPSNWVALDTGDTDISGSGPIPFDLPGSTPSALVAAFGKNGVVYIIDRSNFGGIGTGNGQTGEALVSGRFANNAIINASAIYTTSQGTYLVFRGQGLGCPNNVTGDLTAVKITPGSPPTLDTAWCAKQGGSGSPMVTVSNAQGGDAIVWVVGAEQTNQLQGFDGDTGAVVRAALDTGGTVRHFETPINVDGRIFIGTDGELVAFTSQ